jgi:hypothetical protein
MIYQFVAMTAEGTPEPAPPSASDPAPTPDTALDVETVLELASLEQPEAGAAPALAAVAKGEAYNPLNLKEVGGCREIDRSQFGAIRDKKPGQPGEAPIIYQMLCVAATTPPTELAAAARRDVFFVNLFNDPDLYRGKPIHVEGVLSRLTKREDLAAKNPYGITEVYEAWIFTENQIQNPIVVLLTDIPKGLKPGMEMRENVSLNAYFFKLFAFQTADQKWHAGPMLIGHSMTWKRVAEGMGSTEALWLGVGFVLLLTAGAFIFWWNSRRDDELSDQFHSMVRDVSKPEDTPFVPEDMFEGDASVPGGTKE